MSVAAAFGEVLVDELVRCGLTDLCLAPGSRSAPLVMAALADDRVRVHVRLDERSASFLALGLARGGGRPAAVVCTSGSAAANLHPAVVEADRARIPLLVLTADRPPELRHTAANQTIDQIGLYGRSVRWFCEVGVPEDRPGGAGYWRSTACRAWGEAVGAGGPPGPVHLNLAFREPLVPDDEPLGVDLSGRPGGRPWTAVQRLPRPPHPEAVTALAVACAAERGIVLVGDTDADPVALHALAARLGWPLLAEPHSSARLPGAIAHHDLLLRHAAFADAHRPELVLTVGRPGLARSLLAWLEGAPQILVDADAAWLDPIRDLHGVVTAHPGLLAEALMSQLPGAPDPGSGWLAGWRAADDAVARAVTAALEAEPEVSEPRTARDLAAWVPDGGVLIAASSMPIRDLDLCMAPREGLRVVANRGASGIDGYVSTAVGVALAHDGPAVALAGDLSLLHDQNGLLLADGEPRPDLVLVVVNNDGGGIFSFLPQAEHVGDRAAFERLFGTPHGVDLAAVAAAARVGHRRVGAAADLVPALDEARSAGGIQLVEVRTDRDANLALHRRLQAAAAEALG